VRLREHIHNLQQGLLEKSKLAQLAYEEGHRVGCDETMFLEIESNSRHRKYKESAHVAQPTRSANPVWTFVASGSPLSATKLPTRREGLYDVTDSSWFQFGSSLECSGFTPQMVLAVGSTSICFHGPGGHCLGLFLFTIIFHNKNT
jgi:hypothetical protein